MSDIETATENNADHWWGEWSLPDGVIYLNHGSFGPSPRVVQQVRQQWSRRLESQPMDFYYRQMEDHLDTACQRLAEFVGAHAGDVVFTDNATAAMNVVAANVALEPDDEVLCTDHEYGAVLRIWRHACQRAGAKLLVRKLPIPILSEEELVAEFLAGVTEKTRLIVLSHVTSPTAVILPVETICRRARDLGVPVCVDGPHALAMIPIDLDRLGCDFYTASCHKWLCAPFGTGFLYVVRRYQQGLKPAVVSWGGSISGRPPCWQDEFNWIGTRDPAGCLSVPAAIEFLESVPLEEFRRQTHQLARYTRRRITGLTGMQADVPDSLDWYGSMITLPLPTTNWQPPPHGQRDPLQEALWQQYRIEVPLVSWNGRRFVRVSCHLYNQQADIDRLADALDSLLP